MTSSLCPHLGLASDRTLLRSSPDADHRCYAQDPPGAPDQGHQRAFCFVAGHSACPFYVAPQALAAEDETSEEARPWWRFAYLAVLAVAVLAVAFVYGRDLLRPAAAVAETPPATPISAAATSTAPPAATPSPTLSLNHSLNLFQTPTPEPGGRVLTLSPRAGDAGWWASNETRANHLGDSFLYAGFFEDQAFVAAMRFDLSRIPRGAPLRQALLRLTGLSDDRFRADAGGVWTVHMLAGDAVENFARAGFQEIFNAPAAVTLVPALAASDLGERVVNTWTLDPSARAWLEAAISAGMTELIVRLSGPAGGADTLFSWDSGAGPGTAGAAPELVVSLGPSPSTPPPLPTQPVIVATLSPTPENVLTVAAQALTATAVAATTGTYTPAPANIVTPTPLPQNAATLEALAVEQGLPPLVMPTPTPADAAEATAQAAMATAVALTTGTFTPVPTHAITPSIITPTPAPENEATAVVMALTATALAGLVGTPTPLPYNMLVATPTPRPLLIVPTALPESPATATALAARATLAALTSGTYTPIPTYAVTPTTPPTATPVPLLIFSFDLPTPQPTPTPYPATLPAALRGRILFFSDRPAPPVGENTRLWALTPSTGAVAYVTQAWVYTVAQTAELTAQRPEGVYRLLVEPDPGRNRELQVFVHDLQFNLKTQVSQLTGMSYDAAWSPSGNRIAFVSQEPGNDEIYVVNRDGSGLTRLTFNNWEWDKHPTWSADGSQIVFDSNRATGRRQLWIMNADGGNQRLLLDSPYNDHSPIWVK